jgi:hypothetical protein
MFIHNTAADFQKISSKHNRFILNRKEFLINFTKKKEVFEGRSPEILQFRNFSQGRYGIKNKPCKNLS